MKLFLILITTVFAFSQSVEYQKLKQNHLSVSAQKTLKVPCDLVEFSFQVSGEGSTLEEAVKKAKYKTEQIVSVLLKLGLKKRNLSTTNFHSGENYGDKAFLSSKRDFKAYISTHISLNDMALAEKAMIAISQQHPDEISGLNYSLEKRDIHEQKAVEQASAKALKKAEAIAKSLGTKVIGTLYVEENNVYITPPLAHSRVRRLSKMEAVYDGDSEPILFNQEQEVNATVRIVFQIK